MLNVNYKNIVNSISQLTDRDVEVVAVTKNRSIGEIREVISAGARILGENRIEEAFEKFIERGLKAEFPEVQVHMIGHLQSKKVKKAMEIFDCVQSLDSKKLAGKLNAACGEAGKTIDVLIEVNVSGEEQKYGVAPGDVEELVEELKLLKNVRLKGLMAMAPFTFDKEIQRETFRGLRKLSDKLSEKFGSDYFQVLSMGMSNDYQVAVEEGANMVRIGTAIFED